MFAFSIHSLIHSHSRFDHILSFFCFLDEQVHVFSREMSLLNAVDTAKTLSASVPRTIYKSYVVPNITLGSDDNKLSRDDFPDDFLFGASTSALQTEGTAGGRGPSTWDQFMEGDIAVDSYHRYKDDVAMLKYMSVNAYRFSISWSRILPKGTLVGGINQEGIDFYNNLINDLIANGITPFVTLFHFDMPQALQDAYNGFLSKQIIDDYKNYVNICFENFGDRVKHWATFNEPNVFDAYGYAVGASFTDDLTTMPYIATHNTILAHATAVKLYRENYQALQGGEIGISLMIQWFLPYSHAPNDRDATDRSLDFMIGWYMQPLVTGDYPFSMKSTVGGRLPTFTDEEKALIKGSFDFMTINYYTSRYAQGLPINANDVPVSYDGDHYADYYVTMEEKCAPGDKLIPISPMPKETTDVSVYPLGLGEALAYMKQHYENPKIYITENGTGEARDDSIPIATALQDPDRIEFIQAHLKYVKAALRAGVNVKGYFIWSLIDGMEPAQGYTLRMGLIYIDYLNNLNRIPKQSAEWLKKFLTTNNVV